LAQENLQVIQEAAIHRGKVGGLHVVSVTTLDGKKAELSNVDFPVVPVKTSLVTLPFVQLIAEIRNQSVEKLCK
jgi:hypothetical protein